MVAASNGATTLTLLAMSDNVAARGTCERNDFEVWSELGDRPTRAQRQLVMFRDLRPERATHG